MHHKLLLGSTALVGASLLLANTAAAQEFQVSLEGYTEFGATYGSNDTFYNEATNNRNYAFFMDTEVHILADGEANGIKYGSYLELEVFSNTYQGGSSTTADEANLYFSGGFGRFELGRNDGAEDVMFVGAEDTQSGTGGLDGDTRNLGVINIRDTGDSAKITYFTPRVAGFQLGASFTPDTGDDTGNSGWNGQTSNPGNIQNSIGAGINWTAAFSGVDLILSAVGINGDAEVGSEDDDRDYSVGGRLGVGGLQFGATWGQRTKQNIDFGMLGLKYAFGPASASVGYEHDAVDGGPDQNIYVVSGDVGILPGVVLKADVSYNDNDPFKTVTTAGGLDSGSTWSGVATIQVNY